MLISRSNSHSFTDTTSANKSLTGSQLEQKTVSGDSAARYPESGEKIFEKYLSVETDEPLRNEKEIRDKYFPRFSLLQEIYEQKFTTLMASAAREYRIKNEANEKISKIELLKTYYKRSCELESDCDMCFERLLRLMEKDFKRHIYHQTYPKRLEKTMRKQKRNAKKNFFGWWKKR